MNKIVKVNDNYSVMDMNENEKMIIEIEEIIENRYIDHVLSYSNKTTKINTDVSILFDIETGKYGCWWTYQNLTLSYNCKFEKADIVFRVPNGSVALSSKSKSECEFFKDYIRYIEPWIQNYYSEYKSFMLRHVIDLIL